MIKAKKIWKEKFNQEELTKIWNIFEKNAPDYSFEKSFLKTTKKFGGFIHPETDKEDDSIGIQPEQIRTWIDKYGIQNIDKLIFILGHIIRTNKNLSQKFTDSDGFINWDWLFKSYVLMEEDTDLKEIGSIVTVMLEKFSPKDTLEFIGENPWIGYLIANGRIQGSTESINTFFEERRALWKKVVGIIPKSNILLIMDPNKYSKESVNRIKNTVFNGKQISELSMSDQYFFVSIIDFFDTDIQYIPDELLFNGKIYIRIGVDSFKPQLISKLIVEKKIPANNIYLYINSLKYYPQLNGKHAEIYTRILKTLEGQSSEVIDFTLNFDISKIMAIEKYLHCQVTSTILYGLYNIYSRKSSIQNIEIISGEVDKYSYQVIDKTNSLEGLFLGYETDCCQVIGGNGETCMFSGYNNKNESFFIVKKNGKTFAQSWIWKQELEGIKYIVFDSIEVLGRDLEKSVSIMAAYKEASNKFIELGYDYVLCGADGSTVPKGLKSNAIGKIKNDSEEFFKFKYRGTSGYTDTTAEGFLILAQSH